MEFDPLARDTAPPRHEIESDSEDDDDERGLNARLGRNRGSFTAPKVDLVDFNPKQIKSAHLTVLLSRSGEALSQEIKGQECGKININGDQHGALAWTSAEETSLILLLRPSIKLLSEQDNFAYMSNLILLALQPSNLVLVDDYNPQLYISAAEEKGKAPIRRLSSNSTGGSYGDTAPFESPNYLLGLAAAMMIEASILNVSTTLFMLPQTTNLHLQSWSRLHADSSSLDTKPEPPDAELVASISSLLSLTESHTSPNKGSRFITAFLDERRTQSRRALSQGISGMYV